MAVRPDDDVLNALWPDEEAQIVRRRARPGEVQWWLLPRPSRPSLALPTRSPAAADALASRRAAGLPARVRRAGLAAALRWPSLHVLPIRRLTTQRRPDDLAATLSNALGQPVEFAAFMGPARANRKAVLRVSGAGGTTIAYAKVGHNGLTKALVRAEYLNLQHVHPLVPAHIRVPPVVAYLQWRESIVLITGALEGGSSPESHIPPVAPTIAVAAMGDTRSLELRASPLIRGWRSTLDNLPDGDQRQALSRGLTRLLATCGETSLYHGCWHGDWTPWNLATRGPDWCVWDWERFETGVPVGFDAVHFIAATTGTQMSSDSAQHDWTRAVGQELSAYGVAPGTERVVMAAYFLHVAMRYAEDLRPGLARLQARSEWVIDMVNHLLRDLETR